MASAPRGILGFTLIEMMVTVAVAVILIMLAVPSFYSFQQRSALRAAADQTVSFWNQARFEAAKRNAMIKVSVQTSGSDFCLGAATVTTAEQATLAGGTAITTSCNCLTSSTACDVAQFPAMNSQADWRRVTFVTVAGTTPTLGGANTAVAVIEPKRTALATAQPAGVLTLAGPPGAKSYKVNINIDKFGRAAICESKSAVDQIVDYNNRRCDP